MEDEGDVYELVDEDQYASIVERRRNEDDFVVDDSKICIVVIFALQLLIPLFVSQIDGLGYHDDGEEHLGIGEDDYDGKYGTFLCCLLRAF